MEQVKEIMEVNEATPISREIVNKPNGISQQAGHAFFGICKTKDGFYKLQWGGSCMEKIRDAWNDNGGDIKAYVFFRGVDCNFDTSGEVIDWFNEINNVGLPINLLGIFNTVEEIKSFDEALHEAVIGEIKYSCYSNSLNQYKDPIYLCELSLNQYKNRSYGPYMALCLARYAFYADFAPYFHALNVVKQMYPKMHPFEQMIWAEYGELHNDKYWGGDYKFFRANSSLTPITHKEYLLREKYITHTENLGNLHGEMVSNGSVMSQEKMQLIYNNLYWGKIKNFNYNDQHCIDMCLRYYATRKVYKFNNLPATTVNTDKLKAELLLSGKLNELKEILDKEQEARYSIARIPVLPHSNHYKKVQYKFTGDQKENFYLALNSNNVVCTEKDYNHYKANEGAPFIDLFDGITEYEFKNKVIMYKYFENGVKRPSFRCSVSLNDPTSTQTMEARKAFWDKFKKI